MIALEANRNIFNPNTDDRIGRCCLLDEPDNKMPNHDNKTNVLKGTNARKTLLRNKPEIISACLIFIVCFLIFWLSPVHQVTDSDYSMLLSESLLHHASFELNHYSIPHLEPIWIPHYFRNGEIYQ